MERSSFTLTSGAEVSFHTAGDPPDPALVLIHGFPSSAATFRAVVPSLSEVAHVVAPDLPGFGRSDVLAEHTFDGLAAAVTELLAHLGVGERYLYVHDFGAPVALSLAMADPDLVRGLIIQNGNAHVTGFGPAWADTIAYWSDPDEENEAAATAHLTLEGTRDQYVAGVPDDVAAIIPPAVWEEDWRVMSQPGRRDAQRALIADYGTYVERFDAISAHLRAHQPPALMVWGRHDAFFDIAETLSWMQDLPRMEAHVLDGGHFLLETHAEPAATLIRDFVLRTRR